MKQKERGKHQKTESGETKEKKSQNANNQK